MSGPYTCMVLRACLDTDVWVCVCACLCVCVCVHVRVFVPASVCVRVFVPASVCVWGGGLINNFSMDNKQ